jgi:hypothetical protein
MLGKSRLHGSLVKDVISSLLLVTALLWFSGDMIFGGKAPFYRDLGLYFYPIGYSVAESFKNGELPLWNRHVAMGFPLLANFQSGVFYPPNLLYLLFPFFTTVKWIFFFHYLTAASGSYLLGRQWGYPPFLAFIGALSFTLGGTLISLVNLMNHFQTAVWLPWVLLLSARVLRGRSLLNVIIFIVVLAFQFLAGSPEIYLMSTGLVFLHGLWMRRVENRIGLGRLVFFILACNTVVLGLTMVQVLPTLELLLESRWREPTIHVETALYSMSPLSLLNFVFLDKFMSPELGRGVQLLLLEAPPFLLSHYLGVAAVLGFALWLFLGSLKEKICVGVLGVLFLTLAMGTNTIVYSFLFRQMPFLGLFRFPEKFIFLFSALLIFVSLRGLFLHAVVDRNSLKSLLFASFFVLLPLFAVYGFFRVDTAPLSRFIAWTSGSPALTAATLGKTATFMVNLERQLVLTSAALLLLYLRRAGRIRPELFQPLLVAVVLIDLGSAHRSFQFLLHPEGIYRGRTVLPEREAEPYRLFYYPGGGNLHPSYYILPREPGFAELQSLVYSNLLPNAGVLNDVDYMQEIDAFRRWPYMAFLGVANRLPDEALYRLLGVLNVGYIISFRPLTGKGLTLVEHFPQYPSWLYKVNRSVPRAYVVPMARKESDSASILNRLADPTFDPMKEVILDRSTSSRPVEDFAAAASILRYGNDKVTVRVSLNNPGFLVLADAFYPGWRVYVDARESTIYRANLFFRAVQLPPGEHLVEFQYRPVMFQVGSIISLITVCFLLVFSLNHLRAQHYTNQMGQNSEREKSKT